MSCVDKYVMCEKSILTYVFLAVYISRYISPNFKSDEVDWLLFNLKIYRIILRRWLVIDQTKNWCCGSK